MPKNWDPTEAGERVRDIYVQVLGRKRNEVDDAGLIYWGGKLERGELSVREVVREVGESEEYFGTSGFEVGANWRRGARWGRGATGGAGA